MNFDKLYKYEAEANEPESKRLITCTGVERTCLPKDGVTNDEILSKLTEFCLFEAKTDSNYNAFLKSVNKSLITDFRLVGKSSQDGVDIYSYIHEDSCNELHIDTNGMFYERNNGFLSFSPINQDKVQDDIGFFNMVHEYVNGISYEDVDQHNFLSTNTSDNFPTREMLIDHYQKQAESLFDTDTLNQMSDNTGADMPKGVYKRIAAAVDQAAKKFGNHDQKVTKVYESER
jgi:hypothetical protein